MFLKDLKKLKNQIIYQQVYDLAFETLPNLDSLQNLPNIKALIGSASRYRIRVGDYRIGIEINGDTLELFRVLHRREFYRCFP